METMYYARPNEAGADLFAKWWGRGGAELWDKYDPRCLTEPRSSSGDEVFLGLYSRDGDAGDYLAMKDFKAVTEALDFMFGTDFDKWVERHA